MLVEQRTYTLRPGQVPTFLAIYMDGVFEHQLGILGNLIGYFTSDIGPLNQVVHLWGYDSLDDRMARRKALGETDTWKAFLDKALPLILTMENKILIPASFSPIR